MFKETSPLRRPLWWMPANTFEMNIFWQNKLLSLLILKGHYILVNHLCRKPFLFNRTCGLAKKLFAEWNFSCFGGLFDVGKKWWILRKMIGMPAPIILSRDKWDHFFVNEIWVIIIKVRQIWSHHVCRKNNISLT